MKLYESDLTKLQCYTKLHCSKILYTGREIQGKQLSVHEALYELLFF